jgi:hypothetical protein
VALKDQAPKVASRLAARVRRREGVKSKLLGKRF